MSKQKAPVMASTKPDNVDQEDWSAMQSALSGITKGNSGLTAEQLKNAKESEIGNSAEVEARWAEKAGKHAETYMKVLKLMKDKSKMKLTKIDDEIYKHFRREFPKLKVEQIDYKKDLAGLGPKKQWKKFAEVTRRSWELRMAGLLAPHSKMILVYKDTEVCDYNFGTLLRLNVKEELGAENSAIVYRVQFHAIEIARNREGHNDHIC